LRKEKHKANPESQILEDVVGIVFLQYCLVDFVDKYNCFEEVKLHSILRKTWKKMFVKGHITALKFNFTTELRMVINKELAVGSF